MIRIGTDTWESLPTLRRHFFARFGVGAVIALAIVLATSLFLADALAARWAARALLQDLEDGLYDAVRGGMGGAAGMGGSVGMGGAGGTGGAIRTGGAMGMGMRRMMAVGGTLMLAPETLQAYEPVWPDARRIQSSQATYGSGDECPGPASRLCGRPEGRRMGAERFRWSGPAYRLFAPPPPGRTV